MEATAATVAAWDRAQAGELTVEVISDFESFRALEPVWTRLLQESPIDNPFLSHEWVRTWWESFGDGRELRILVVKDRQEAVAIAPLMLSQRRMYGFAVRCLGFVYNAHTPRCDFIIASRPGEVYRAIWNYLRTENEMWDVLELCQLPAASPTLEELSLLAPEDGFFVERWHSLDSPYLRLQDSWDGYFRSLDRKHRQNLRRRLKRLEELGKVELEVISSGPQLEGALEDGLRLEGSGWKEKGGTAISSRPEVRSFYTELAGTASRCGWLRLCFLKTHGLRVAFGYFLAYKDNYYLLKQGYDPQYSAYSPFNLLCYLLLPDVFAGRIAELDFLGETEGWKLDWTAEVRPHYWLYIFPGTPGLRLIRWLKFSLIPRLQQRYFYRFVRDSLLTRNRRARF